MEQAQWWWVGGHIDGDGCVRLSDSPCLEVGKATKGLPSLQYLQKLFGGSIYDGKPPNDNRRPRCHVWRLRGRCAQDLCGQLAPYTIAKRAQLELVADWPLASQGRNMSAETATTRKQLDTDMRALKKQPHPTTESMPHDAYFAGFFDAEGCICLRKSHHRQQLQAIVTQKYRAILDLFCKRFDGGSVSQTSQAYRYCACGSTARALMTAVLPHSIEKLPQWHIVVNMHSDPDAALNLNALKGRR